MKIIKLTSENFKKIKAVEIQPKSNTVIISGRNGQGKTSVLDSIFVALCGKQREIVKPIREGEAKSTIRVELDKYYVTRTFTQGSGKLEVISKEGEIMPSPQTLLDEIIGKLSFDPLQFASLKEKEQRELLLTIIGVNLDEFDKQRKELYDYRHDLGVTMNSMQDITLPEVAEAEQIIKEGRIDSKAINAKISEQMVIAENLKKAKWEVDELNREILNLQTKRDIKLKEIQDLEPKVVDIADLRNKMTEADERNNKVFMAEKTIEAFNRRNEIKKKYETYTSRISTIDEDKNTALKAAKMPIEGLEVSDSGVMFNKIPFAQLSSAEKLKVSMSIAMAMNPELRIIRILDGSLLDDTNMQVINEMAKDNDFQVWVERVDSTGKVGFYIEEGEVKAINEN